jgi:hypothetical protein
MQNLKGVGAQEKLWRKSRTATVQGMEVWLACCIECCCSVWLTVAGEEVRAPEEARGWQPCESWEDLVVKSRFLFLKGEGYTRMTIKLGSCSQLCVPAGCSRLASIVALSALQDLVCSQQCTPPLPPSLPPSMTKAFHLDPIHICASPLHLQHPMLPVYPCVAPSFSQ